MVRTTRSVLNILCGAALALCLSWAPGVYADVVMPIPGDPVAIDTGNLAGTMMPSGVHAYLGIPFAAPPVRELRWKAPQPAKPWQGTYFADSFKPECLQPARDSHGHAYYGESAMSEDCLYLNVWAPANAKPGARLPVLVYIYGGGFTQGSGNWTISDGRMTARKGVIQVDVSYRLGIMGFLAHPDLSKETGYGGSGDWGLLDQVAALKWVQRNIAAFGGDPSRVTIMGQSAGAMSVTFMQLSPLAKGTFVGGVALSGGGAPAVSSLRDAEAVGTKLQQAMGAKTIDDLRLMAGDRVMWGAAGAHLSARPVVDGNVVVDQPAAIIAAGKQADVPMIASSMANDLGTDNPFQDVHTMADYTALADKAYGPDGAQFLKLFPVHSDEDVSRQDYLITSETGIMGQGTRAWALAQAKTGKAPVYVVLFGHVQPYSMTVPVDTVDPKNPGARHTDDISYWLGTLDLLNDIRQTRDWTADDRKLSGQLQDVLVAFATTGVPKTAELSLPKFDPNDPRRAFVGKSAITIEKINGPQMDFLKAHPIPVTRRASAPGGGY